MAYDGFAVAATVKELNDTLLLGSITKIAQPEPDEILLTVKNNRQNRRLSLSANASLPMIVFREDSILSPAAAPNFCMTLRKHIGGGRILRIYQPGETIAEEGLERIAAFEIEHLNEMGDTGKLTLVCELMGKHSNIILLKEDGTILDSIKHVPQSVSSVREVLPGRPYFIPDTRKKVNPFSLLPEDGLRQNDLFFRILCDAADPLQKAVYGRITGFSPILSEELLFRAGVDGDRPAAELSEDEKKRIYRTFCGMLQDVRDGKFQPCLLYEGEEPAEFSAVSLTVLSSGGYREERCQSIFEVLTRYYAARARHGRIRAKSEDIRHVLKLLLERNTKKLELWERQYQDAEKKDKYRIYGELLNTYGYSLRGGEREYICENYYDNGKTITIPLEETLSASENAKKFFARYQKLKRTQEALKPQIAEAKATQWHLESIEQALSIAESEADLNQLRQEMREYGFLKKAQAGKKQRKEEQHSEPMHFVSSDGVDIFVGRNNYQNEEITFRAAEGNDWWFHAKNMPGSHVIAKTGNRELPDKTCIEAAELAAYYSRAGGEQKMVSKEKIEVDYVQRKALKRVPGAAPGYVIYHTNYSVTVEPKKEIGYTTK